MNRRAFFGALAAVVAAPVAALAVKFEPPPTQWKSCLFVADPNCNRNYVYWIDKNTVVHVWPQPPRDNRVWFTRVLGGTEDAQ